MKSLNEKAVYDWEESNLIRKQLTKELETMNTKFQAEIKMQTDMIRANE
jgi:hypothetical protein